MSSQLKYVHYNTPRPVIVIPIAVILFLMFIIPGIVYIAIVDASQRRWDDDELLKSVTFLDRGEVSERKLVLDLLKSGYNADSIFHDMLIKFDKLGSTQVDLALITDAGIIVIEVKDYSGWLFGNGNHTNWTQVLDYGRTKYRFYNPVKQNQTHIKHIKTLINQNDVPVFNLVVFYGDCTLKKINDIPSGAIVVKSNDILYYINNIVQKSAKITYKNKQEISDKFRKAVEYGNDVKNYNVHLAYVINKKNEYNSQKDKDAS